MYEDLGAVRMSSLSRTVACAGKTVQIDIYQDSMRGWLLEIIDEYDNSTIWDNPFETEEIALREALRFLSQSAAVTLDRKMDKAKMARLLTALN